MPIGAVPIAAPKGQAAWTTGDTNVDRLRDFFLSEGRSAGYKPYTIILSAGSIYDLLLVKGGTTFALNITQGSEVSVLTGRRIETMHLEISGATTVSADLPLRDYIDISPTGEIAVGTDIPNDQCTNCEYLVYVHIAPFNGPGVYQSKPVGIYLIDAEVIPGRDAAANDYRWAQQCTVLVPDATSGSFACAGLENVNDSSKRLNVTGTWQQPPATP